MSDHSLVETADALKTSAGLRCAIYTRKSTEEGLKQPFNSLEAQRESAEAYILSQRHAGWNAVPEHYDDGGYTGGNLERPALQKLVADIKSNLVDCVVVYKVDRLSRSLLDFARLMEVFERHRVSLVSVTQPLNTTVSLGRLTLNILLSFAQFEREIVAERTRDKIGAAKRKGKWMGGIPVLGYDLAPGGGRLVVHPEEAQRVRALFDCYLKSESLEQLLGAAEEHHWTNKVWRRGTAQPRPFTKAVLRRLLSNPLYIGKVRHREETYAGEHEAIIAEPVWRQVQQLLMQERSRRSMRKKTVPIDRKREGQQAREKVVCERVPRIARLMALALKFETMIQTGTVRDYRTLAALARISQPRLTQILNLRNLAPDIQEQLLFLTTKTGEPQRITEKTVRQLSSLLHWSEQRARWASLTSPTRAAK